jgi:hypothetical protein|tara:strand:- start:16901 stop:17263 length:363 start_codon:yes stop_codon:yes gene_type:complete
MRHLRHRELDGLARDRLDHTKDALSLGIVPGAKPTYVFTADNLTNQLTVAGEDNLAADNPRVILEGSLPAELDTGVLYWIADAGLNLYTLHPTKADAAAGTNTVAFTDDGTGTLVMTILD